MVKRTMAGMDETGEQWGLICTRIVGQSAKCLFCTPKDLNPTFRTHNKKKKSGHGAVFESMC